MIDIENTLLSYQKALCTKIDIAGLYARSNIAHKWKLTFRLIALREGMSWRVVDLLLQAYKIGLNKMTVGARILTRSALETVCLLIYMNERIQSVVENKMSFNDFNEITVRLLMGAKNRTEWPLPINVMTLVEESEKLYPGVKELYNDLCETAHPNYDGVCAGYMKIYKEKFEAEFGIYWEERFGNQHEAAIRICIKIFEEEYNNKWPKLFEALERWLEENDKKLERQHKK